MNTSHQTALRRTRPQPERLRLTLIEDEESLGAAEHEWNGLFATVERPSACASHAWITAWWQTFGENPRGAGRETHLFVVAVRDAEDRLVGIVPFFEERSSNPLLVRRLRPIGFLGRGEAFDMTEEPSCLFREGWESRVLDSVAELLGRHVRRGRWDAVAMRVHHNGAESPLQAALTVGRLAAWVRATQRSGSYYADLPPSWAAYRKLLSRSMRDNLAYYPRLLTRAGHDWNVRIVRNPQEMPAAASRLAELHHGRARSDKGPRHHDHMDGPAQEAFLRTLLQRFAQRGEAFVAELVVNGKVVGSQAFVESGGTLVVYYSGYDEAWYKYSPIFVIDAWVFRDALERGVRRIDFLRGEAPWKSRWGAVPGPALHRLVAIRAHPTSLLRLGVQGVRQSLRCDVVDRLPILFRDLRGELRHLGSRLRSDGAEVTPRLE